MSSTNTRHPVLRQRVAVLFQGLDYKGDPTFMLLAVEETSKSFADDPELVTYAHVDIPVPTDGWSPKAVEVLRKEIEQINATAALEISSRREKISKLLAIGMNEPLDVESRSTFDDVPF